MRTISLTKALVLDAASCALFFALCVGATAAVAGLLGLPAAIVAAAGWICLPVAALLAFLAIRPVRPLLLAVAVGNVGWVLASLAVWLIHFDSLTATGHVAIVGQAIAVELFAVLEWRGWKRLAAQPATAS
ncbi:hypothetical protein V5F89_13285 [Pelagerythrobacter marensis]|uniref:Uncharacterized protein n=1 Tax=Pelagerythrobacter marensis TaxID=543877 RepID=A0ABZ2D8R8_9SPHN